MRRSCIAVSLSFCIVFVLFWGAKSVLDTTDEVHVVDPRLEEHVPEAGANVPAPAVAVAPTPAVNDASAQANYTTRRQLNMNSEILPNGIRLPRQWPPSDVTFEHLLAKEPPTAPYLATPPDVIRIDIGRQLFVDNFLVMRTDAVLTHHRAVHRDVVLKPVQQEWHSQSPKWTFSTVGFHRVGTSRPFSGGIWYDDVLKRFIAHYRCAYIYSGTGRPCVVLSEDGVHWTRPQTTKDQFTPLDLKRIPNPPVNLMKLPFTEAFTTWLDPHETDPQHRFKAVCRARQNIAPMTLHSSADGITWKPYGKRKTGLVTDRASIYYDPFRKKWVYSIRENLCRGGHGHLRVSRYKEVDALADSTWPDWVSLKNYFQCALPTGKQPMYWIGVDRYDCEGTNVEECDLYHIDATPYESILVGQLAVLYPGYAHGGCKSSKIHIGFSRDGFHFSRSHGDPGKTRMPMVDDPLDLHYQQPIAGNFVVVGDEIFVYYGGATQCKRCNDPKFEYCTEGNRTRDGNVPPTQSSMIEVTALAILRRDGFASFAPQLSGQPAEVVTRTMSFKHGVYLFVNADVLASGGSFAAELRVAVLNSDLTEHPEFSIANCKTIRAVNETKILVEWDGASSSQLRRLQDKGVHFRFVMQGAARLYSFWVSEDLNGGSSGYVNGGIDRMPTTPDTLAAGSVPQGS